MLQHHKEARMFLDNLRRIREKGELTNIVNICGNEELEALLLRFNNKEISLLELGTKIALENLYEDELEEELTKQELLEIGRIATRNALGDR